MEMRCGCKIDGNVGERVMEPCERHDEWMRTLVRAEREECARIADESAAADRRKGELFSKMGALDAGDSAYEDFAVTAEVIASRIRKRTPLMWSDLFLASGAVLNFASKEDF